MAVDLKELAAMAMIKCRKRGWDRSWLEIGCYLHLEVSEFVEALRGKGEDPDPAGEAADVLFVLLSTLEAHDIDLDDVIAKLNAQLDKP